MPTIDLGNVNGDKGDTGVSMRTKGAWTSSTSYVNNTQYIDVVTYGGSSYACKTSHTSSTSFESDKWNLIAQKGEKGDIGVTPTIKAGTATVLESTSAPTVSATTSGDITTFNFGIPKGDTSEIKTPTFDDSIDTYSTLDDANDAAETASNAIKSKVSIFTTLSNMKKSFSAIIQGLKILGTNVGAIRGITSDVAGESEDIAASIKVVNQINSNLTSKSMYQIEYFDSTWIQFTEYGNFVIQTGIGLHVFNCVVNIPNQVPDGQGMFSVDARLNGFLLITQLHSGKSYPVHIVNGQASACGIIEKSNNCVMHGVLTEFPL